MSEAPDSETMYELTRGDLIACLFERDAARAELAAAKRETETVAKAWEHWVNEARAETKAARAGLDRLRQRIEVIRDDGYRVGCDCGHATFVHAEGTGCIGGLLLCKCRHSWWTILRDRLDAALAPTEPAEEAT